MGIVSVVITAPKKSESKSQFDETHSKLAFSCPTGTQDTIILSSGVAMNSLSNWRNLGNIGLINSLFASVIESVWFLAEAG